MDIIDIYHIYPNLPKAVIGAIILVILCFDIISVVLINKTKRTSKNTRFLSSSLVLFDSLSLVTIFARLWVGNGDSLMRLREAGFYTLLLGFVTVCLMCVERLILFSAPTKYMVYFRYTSLKKLAVFLWILLLSSLIVWESAHCGLQFHFTPTFFNCMSGTIKVAGSISFVINITAAVCYVRIYFLVRTLSRPTNPSSAQCAGSPHYKPALELKNTNLVLMYLVTITVTNICLVTWYAIGTTSINLRIFSDAVIMMAAITDPCLYVFWFKECKLELLKIFARCLPSLKDKVYTMRVDVFNIVTTSKSEESRKPCMSSVC